MKPHNGSPQEMLFQMAVAHVPECRFDETDQEGFFQWKKTTLPRVLSTLGNFPPSCDPRPRLVAEWKHDGLQKQRWQLDLNPWLTGFLDVNFPNNGNGEHPAILICPGHAREVGRKHHMGNANKDLSPTVPVPPDAYGHHVSKMGYVTFAIDFLGIGDFNDAQKPNWKAHAEGRDWCNLYYLASTLLGMTNLSINMAHIRVAMDLVSTLPGVKADAMGVMGSSGGGTNALWITLLDERIKATEIICYSSLFAEFGYRDLNFCGWQITPGLFELVDVPELQGLIAPRPLLVDIGIRDECFRLESAMECYRRVERIYKSADAADRLRLDLHPGGHTWAGNLTEMFFKSHLG